MVQGSYDFIGINYYASRYVKELPINPSRVPVGYAKDRHLTFEDHKDGMPIGNLVQGNPNIYFYPRGLRDALMYMKLNYHDPKIYITENGVCEPRNDSLLLNKALDDQHRIIFILHHLNAIQEALRYNIIAND